MVKRIFALVCIVMLSACGGGGGSSPAPQTGGGSSGGSAPIQTTSVQRADAAQSLSAYNETQQAVQYGSSSGANALSLHRLAQGYALRAVQAYQSGARSTRSGVRHTDTVYSSCSNGFEDAVVQVSQTEFQVYERDFYDSSCTTLWQDIYLDFVATSNTAVTAAGTDTYYSVAGSVVDYQSVALALAGIGTGSPAFALEGADAAHQGAPNNAEVGVACGASASSLACGAGATAREASLSQDIGATLGFAIGVGSVSGNVVPVSVSGSAAAYVGSLGALSLAQAAFPNFAITGGTTTNSATFAATLSFTTSGVPTGGALTLTDSAADGTVTIATVGSPATGVTGTIKRTSTGQVLATFTTDLAGNGTITYSNGTTAQIVAWNVVG
jgi:hypothetical protein